MKSTYIRTDHNDNGSIDYLYMRDDGACIILWYNRTERSWVTMLVDNFDHKYQCGASSYDYTREDAIDSMRLLDHGWVCDCK